MNGKKIYRLAKTMGLLVPKKIKPKRTFKPQSDATPIAVCQSDVWAIDFVSDKLLDGRSYRYLTIIDTYTREIPGIQVNLTMALSQPVHFLENLKQKGKMPRAIIVDNGPEFANRIFVNWCKTNNIKIHFIDPGRPVQNGYIESFNGKFRKEFLSQKMFKTILEASYDLESWIHYYNNERPHSSLDYFTPKEFADQEKAMLEKNQPVLKTG